MKTEPAKIVLIEDHPEYLAFLATLLRRCGYRVEACASAREALQRLEQDPADLVITDIFMPGMDGFEVLRDVKRARPALPIIAVSGSGPQDRGLFLDAMRQLGAAAGFAKPVDIHSLVDTVGRLTGTTPPLLAMPQAKRTGTS